MVVAVMKVNGSNLITDLTEQIIVVATEYKFCCHDYQILKD